MEDAIKIGEVYGSVPPLIELCSEMRRLLGFAVKLPVSSRNSERVKGTVDRNGQNVKIDVRLKLNNHISQVHVSSHQLSQVIIAYQLLEDTERMLSEIGKSQCLQEDTLLLKSCAECLVRVRIQLDGKIQLSSDLEEYCHISLDSGQSIWVDLVVVACELNFIVIFRKNEQSSLPHGMVQYEKLSIASVDPYLISIGVKLESLHHRLDIARANFHALALTS